MFNQNVLAFLHWIEKVLTIVLNNMIISDARWLWIMFEKNEECRESQGSNNHADIRLKCFNRHFWRVFQSSHEVVYQAIPNSRWLMFSKLRI